MTTKEIGGYIELDMSRGEEYHSSAIALNSGRHCLEYLIKARKINKLYIPYFLCASVKAVCEKLYCEYEYYNIDTEFRPVFDKKIGENEYIYIVNYYGQLSTEYLEKMRECFGNIIIDNAQDFFKKPIKGVDILYTCRKFFGVSDGGYLYTDAKLEYDLLMDTSYDRIHYVLGRFEEGATKFYQESADNNKLFADEKLKSMSKLTHNLLRGIDYDFIKERRTVNFNFLHNSLKSVNKLTLTVPEGAFMYPLYIDNGAQLKKKLIQNKIFVPTLWADVFDVCGKETLEYEFANNIVPLPIDQRYDIEDMRYIIRVVEENILNG